MVDIGIILGVGNCNMYTCSGSSIQERSAGFPMFSFDLLITCL